jgi:hypothetical protein
MSIFFDLCGDKFTIALQFAHIGFTSNLQFGHIIFCRLWTLGPPTEKELVSSFEDFLAEYKNPSFIVLIYGMTFVLVGRDWRKRKWT